jgi:hypothetical protein
MDKMPKPVQMNTDLGTQNCLGVQRDQGPNCDRYRLHSNLRGLDARASPSVRKRRYVTAVWVAGAAPARVMLAYVLLTVVPFTVVIHCLRGKESVSAKVDVLKGDGRLPAQREKDGIRRGFSLVPVRCAASAIAEERFHFGETTRDRFR